MRFYGEGLNRRRISIVLWITGFWTAAAVLDVLNTHAISGTALLAPTPVYNFPLFFTVNTLTAVASSLLSGSLLMFFLRDQVRSRSFGFAIMVNSFLIALLNVLFSTFGLAVYLSYQLGVPCWSETVKITVVELMRSGLLVKNIIFWSLVSFATTIMLHVNDKYGPGVLGKFLIGRYHKPREEERIFLFADIRSSTLMAERLGHIRFFNLLNDFYRDLTNPIIAARGEIYQYVGDMIVISWPAETGLEQANCIRCYYGMQTAIRRQAPRYLEKYGLVPEFKAGLHCGEVTVGEIGVIKKDLVFSGDVLSTTSRLQDLCNEYGVKILLSKYLLDKLNIPPNDLAVKRVDLLELKGKQQKIEMYTFPEENPKTLDRLWMEQDPAPLTGLMSEAAPPENA